MKADIYNTEGKKGGSLVLPEAIFDVKLNKNLIHQVAVSLMANARTSAAHTKDRSEVRGGGRKPWRQKGTGNARHGSTRSPIWIGGGVTFGPRNDRSFEKKINKKMKRRAFISVLSEKVRRGDVLFLEPLSFAEPKTKKGKAVLERTALVFEDEKLTGKKNAFLLVTPERDEVIEKSFRNIGNVGIVSARNMNVLDLLNNKKVIFIDGKACLGVLNNRFDNARSEKPKNFSKKEAHKTNRK